MVCASLFLSRALASCPLQCGQGRRAALCRMAAQALQYGVPRARERLPVAVQLEGPVRPQLEGVKLEGELHGVDLRVELPRVLRLRDGAQEHGEPLLHDFRYAVAHRARAAVELRRGG